jgi:hypothetical protein
VHCRWEYKIGSHCGRIACKFFKTNKLILDMYPKEFKTSLKEIFASPTMLIAALFTIAT